MEYQFDEQVSDILLTAKRYAEIDKDTVIRPSHVLYSILKEDDNLVIFTLESMNVELDILIDATLEVRKQNIVKTDEDEDIPCNQELLNIFKKSAMLNNPINLIALILGMLSTDSELKDVFEKNLVDYDIFEDLIFESEDHYNGEDNEQITFDIYVTNASTTSAQIINFSYDDGSIDGFEEEQQDIIYQNSFLERFATNLNKLAAENKLDSCIGRDEIINNLLRVLNRKKKRNAILAGLAGVGKTQIVEGLAQKIVNKEVPFKLQNKIIYSLSLNDLVAGTKYRGEFEERIKHLIKEIESHKEKYIIFIDEIHTMTNAGAAEGALNFNNILKPYLQNGTIQVIGTTTFDELKYLTKDKALKRRFDIINVPEMSEKDTVKILQTIKKKYEKEYNVKFSQKMLERIVFYSKKYVQGVLPDVAIEVFDDLCSKIDLEKSKITKNPYLVDLEKLDQEKLSIIKNRNYERVNEIYVKEKNLLDKYKKENIKLKKQNKSLKNISLNDIQKLIFEKTGVKNVEESEVNILEKFNIIRKKVLGQNEAINLIEDALLINTFDKEAESTKPIGTFLFVGQTGVGKTELAKQIAYNFFGSEDKLIRIDCSEYEHSTSKLIGASSGLVGYDEGGILTNAVKNNPYSVILFDEFEKGSSKLQDILLQVTSEGFLTDNKGDKVDFRNTLIILTSNLGIKKASENRIGFVDSQDDFEKIIHHEVNKAFKLEFINRLTDVVVFNSLTYDVMLNILKKEVLLFEKQLKQYKVKLNIRESVLDKIVNDAMVLQMGARPIGRLFNKEVKIPIIRRVIKEKLKNTTIELEESLI